jgi:ABC-2 type transport system permease protein
MSVETAGWRRSFLRVRRMVAKELKQLLRDPLTKRMIFGAPIIQLLLFGYAVNTDVRNATTFVVDHDHTEVSRRLVDAFTASGYFRVVGASDRSADIQSALDHGKAIAGLEIPPEFARDVKAGRSPAVQLVVDGSNSNTATVAEGYAAKIAQAFSARLALDEGTPLPHTVELRTRAWFNPSLESRVYNVPAVMGVIVLLMCLILTALAVVREREVGTLEQLLVSPLSPGELMLGKTIPVAAVAMVQMAMIATVALLWFHIPLRGSVLALILAAALFIVAGLSFGLFISTISSTQQEAFLAMFLFLMPAIILSGFLYPIDTMPWVFRELTLLNPLRHFLQVVRAIFLKGSGVRELWAHFLILAVMAAGGVAMATRRFKKTL